MKKQINPTIKAYLVRSGFYLLLLLAVCAIPFALAQRNTTKQSAAKLAAKALPPLSHLKPILNPGAAGPQAARPISAQLPYDVRGVPYLPRMSQVPQNTSGVAGAHVIPIPPTAESPAGCPVRSVQ